MTIYQHRDTIIASAGSTNTITLNVRGGLLRQFYIASNTTSTVFRANITDEKGIQVINYGFHTGNINDTGIAIPMAGKYILNVTNASPDDSFKILFSVEE